jgi:tRNA-modifying protein YgfZ
MHSAIATAVARRPRAFVRVSGPQAGEFLQRMVSNDVLALGPGDSCDALLLTPKARIVATLRVLRRSEEDFLLLTEPELGEVVSSQLQRARFAARCEIAPEEHTSLVLLGAAAAPEGRLALPTDDYGLPGFEVLDSDAPSTIDADALERLRIEAGTPRFGLDLDDRVMPAEAGLVERAVNFSKGCYPGQEPIARLHYRGHANRALRVLRIESAEPPPLDTEIVRDGKTVGRVTSAVRDDDGVVALGYVRTEVPEDAELSVNGARARMTPPMRPRGFEPLASASAGLRSIP